MTASKLASLTPLAVAVALLFGSAVAEAQESPAAVSEALFQQGKRLMADGKFAEACPKLAESQRLDPGGGTLTALALCHKGQGKTASAWGEFKEVLSQARRDGRKDREQVAQENIAELEPKLARLKLDVVPQARAQNVEIRLDGTVVGNGAFGEALPVNPGPHAVEAKAPGKKTFTSNVTIAAEREEKVVVVPELLDEEPAPPTEALRPATLPSSPPPATDSGFVRRTLGWGLAGAGAVTIAVGGIFGLRALGKETDSDSACGNPCDNADGLQFNHDARNLATLSNVFMGTGLVVLAGGLVLALTAPAAPTHGALSSIPRPGFAF